MNPTSQYMERLLVPLHMDICKCGCDSPSSRKTLNGSCTWNEVFYSNYYFSFFIFSLFFSFYFLCVSSFYFFSYSPLSLVFTLNCFTKLHIHVILSHDALVVNKYFWGILQNWKNICFFRFLVFCSYLQMKGIYEWKVHCMACCNLQCCFLVLYMAFLFLLAFFFTFGKGERNDILHEKVWDTPQPLCLSRLYGL